LVRQQLSESLLLSLLGMAFGLLLASWLVEILPGYVFHRGSSAAWDLDCRLDWRMVLGTVGLTALAALLAGLAPLLRTANVNLTSALKGLSGAETGGPVRVSLRNLLVIGQLSVAFVFVTTGGVLIQTVRQSLASTSLGAPREAVLVAFKGLDQTNQAWARAYHSALTERLAQSAGPLGSSWALHVPGTDYGGPSVARAFVEDGKRRLAQNAIRASINVVDTNLFAALGMRLLAGRAFASEDEGDGRRVVVVSEALSERFWPGGQAMGRQVRFHSSEDEPWEVVGVVRDGREARAEERNWFNLYVPRSQWPGNDLVLVVAAPGRARDYVPVVEQVVAGTDPAVTVARIDTLAAATHKMAWRSARLLWPLMGLGILSCAMALAGLYALMSWSVARRTREIGIRAALGAGRLNTEWLVLKQGLGLVTGGMLIGLPLSAGVAQLLWSFAPIVRSAFFLVAPLAVIAVIGVGLLACYLPARRAARVEPMVALRTE
jgi:predicted permease